MKLLAYQQACTKENALSILQNFSKFSQQRIKGKYGSILSKTAIGHFKLERNVVKLSFPSPLFLEEKVKAFALQVRNVILMHVLTETRGFLSTLPTSNYLGVLFVFFLILAYSLSVKVHLTYIVC